MKHELLVSPLSGTASRENEPHFPSLPLFGTGQRRLRPPPRVAGGGSAAETATKPAARAREQAERGQRLSPGTPLPALCRGGRSKARAPPVRPLLPRERRERGRGCGFSPPGSGWEIGVWGPGGEGGREETRRGIDRGGGPLNRGANKFWMEP